ncbi:hypothetical protein FBU30_006879 [Linnemannia zychae]|nr:hypothetical protein FBU30_006879 [Linnemannia zychae]
MQGSTSGGNLQLLFTISLHHTVLQIQKSSGKTNSGCLLNKFAIFLHYPQPPTIYSLYAKGRVLGFKRAKRNQRPDISLIQIEGVKTAADTDFYLGKRVAFVYRAKREVNGSKIRCIWGRITRAHGGSGAVKARFRNNLPAKSFGASVRVVSLLCSISVDSL